MWNRLSGWMIGGVALMLLSGCASFTTQTEFSSEAELVATRGQPANIWENDDGTRTFEYSTQPFGETAWMYTIDASGVVIEQHDALARRNLANVRKGMTLAEVQRMLGQHRSIQKFALSGEEVWDWNVANEYPGIIATHFNVHFIDGSVERTSYSYIYPGNGDLGVGFGHFSHPYWGLGWAHPFGPPYARWRYGYGVHPWYGWPHYW